MCTLAWETWKGDRLNDENIFSTYIEHKKCRTFVDFKFRTVLFELDFRSGTRKVGHSALCLVHFLCAYFHGYLAGGPTLFLTLLL